ncbi:MAG: hypothetical protein NTY53_27190, partial [Kiritimatiellaeota bacterium]|nr:hypothetical protein [Kiritimatiellota bacterium]
RTFRQVVFAAAALLPVSLLLASLGVTGPAYASGAVFAGSLMLATGVMLARARSLAAAHTLMRLALAYLPFLLGMVAWDCYR